MTQTLLQIINYLTLKKTYNIYMFFNDVKIYFTFFPFFNFFFNLVESFGLNSYITPPPPINIYFWFRIFLN
jgi:hypothetical protein